MAKTKINHMFFLTSLFLLAFPIANAIPRSEIENLCKETTDAAFCITHIESDPRIGAARDISAVLTVVISLLKIQVNDAINHIDNVRQKYNGPNGRRRINLCKKNYGIASDRFHTAWQKGLNKSLPEANRLLNVGTNAVTDCENGWRRGGPVQTSPLTSYNTNIVKLSGIAHVIIQKLGR